MKMFSILLPLLIVGLTHASPVSPKGLAAIKIEGYNGSLTEESLGTKFDNVGALEIYSSKITGVTKDFLRQFNNLENLTISHTHLDKPEADIFTNCCPNLKQLEVNTLEDFNDKDLKGIGALPALERLEFLHQDIPILKSGVFTGTNLKSLSLVDCNIEKIEDDAFNNLGKLEFIRISHNKLPTIKKEVLAPLKNLGTIELDSNGMEKFSTHDLPKLPNLTDIVIKDNLKEAYFDGATNVAPNLSDIFLIGYKDVQNVKADGPIRIHN
ncbi:hypothetical protein HHI36_000289 [Cryptolaemus montrouzieri]|uniref:Leucine-rich repeat domain-containing protein n=1 Tax=Cryptolaemus montrouzieri TaxID=559131 RepID=A0ABD2P463_9CUCU